MTDIRHHLKGIRKILFKAIESDNTDIDDIRASIRAFLPKSYGMATGALKTCDKVSQPVPMLLYDIPQAGGSYADEITEYPIDTALFVLEFAKTYTLDELRNSLERIASVKQLQTSRERDNQPEERRPVGQNRRTVPKDRLPFALLYCDSIAGISQDELFSVLFTLIRDIPHDLLPDQVDIMGQNAQFLNALLQKEQANWFDIGWSQTPDLPKVENCYVCKQKFLRRHFHYDQLCMDCADLSYSKRLQSVDLSNHRILVTGARLKIGYYTALRLLRSGAEVIATSRFPRDAARRYAQEDDFEDWSDRLHIYGLDMRQVGYLGDFVTHLKTTYSYLDGIINNAAQTVKRPPAFYAHLIAGETTPLNELPIQEQHLLAGEIDNTAYLQPSIAGQLPAGDGDPNFPHGQFDEFGQQVDNRDYNSWVMRLEDVPPIELAEVHLVNAIAPAILTGQLKSLLMQSPHERQFIINVSAAEGRFAQFKNGYHPHTNMAKAALNMLTRSIAQQYREDGILVTSVDPGWVSDQVPRTNDSKRSDGNERIPIDMIDAAARVCDPLFDAITTNTYHSGILLKDFRVVDW